MGSGFIIPGPFFCWTRSTQGRNEREGRNGLASKAIDVGYLRPLKISLFCKASSEKKLQKCSCVFRKTFSVFELTVPA